jgi:hypothetical protein
MLLFAATHCTNHAKRHLRHCAYFLTAQYISAIQPQQATGHKKCILDNVEDGFDDIVQRAGALQQGVINEGFFAGFAQQAPAPGFFCATGCNKASMISFTRTQGALIRPRFRSARKLRDLPPRKNGGIHLVPIY